MDPASGSFTGIARPSAGEAAWIGQMAYKLGQRSAHLTYLISADLQDTRLLPALVEYLITQAGAWGAFNVLAEIDERSPAFESLRKTGFVIYSRQTVWSIPGGSENGRKGTDLRWQPADVSSAGAIRTLYNCLVPPLVQTAEPIPLQPGGLVYRQDGEVLAYVEQFHGPRGIYLLPVVHPNLDNIHDLLRALLHHLSPVLRRPVYLAVRSYQAWLDDTLTEMGAVEAPRQSLLVRHLTQRVTAPVKNSILIPVESRAPETSSPISRQFSVHRSRRPAQFLPGTDHRIEG